MVQLSTTARLLIVGQAPGRKVHETGIPWNDASGARLRDWLDLDPSAFYDKSRVAILPIGFCYPGASQSGGDNPPRRECAPRWHGRLTSLLPNLQLTLLVGRYAQHHYLALRAGSSMTEAVMKSTSRKSRYFRCPIPVGGA